jgi:hypothetical protein
MDVKYTLGHMLGNGERRASQIVITIDAGEDPDGHIVGLLMRDRLETFLRIYPRPMEFPAEDAAYARSMLGEFAFVAGICRNRMEMLLLAARDQYGLSWAVIADQAEMNRSTARDHVMATRKQFAEMGWWFDGAGAHQGTPEEASAALSGVWEND